VKEEILKRLEELEAKVELQRKRLDVLIHGKDLDDSYNPALTVIGPASGYIPWQGSGADDSDE